MPGALEMIARPAHYPMSRGTQSWVLYLLVALGIGLVTAITVPTLALADAKSARHDALRDLRAFASAQELFRERHGRFATGADVHAAPVTGGLRFAWHRGIEPIAIRTAPNGWSAEVRLSSGTRCALVVGTVQPPASVPGLVPGIPACEL